jgi:hypothetical protein
MMGFDPTRIAYLHEAGRFLGQGDLDRIVQRGEDPSAYTTPFQPAPGQEGAATSSF